MIQIIPPNYKKSFNERLGAGMAAAGQSAAKEIPSYYQGQEQKQKEKDLAEKVSKLTGQDLSGFSTEALQRFAEVGLKNQQDKKINDLKSKVDDERYQTIKKHFGEKEAEIYKAAPEGGKTEILKHLYEKEQRNNQLDKNLKDQGVVSGLEDEEDLLDDEISPLKKAAEKFIDFDKGLTPKERVRREESRYGINLPLYQSSVDKSRALDSEKDHLDILEELSPQIGTFQRLNINPQTGDLFLPAAASTEAQRYVKTLNDFTTNAKDSYGARVTNFDLQQFMRRLPTLANSEEGRAEILKQMKIINEINSTREKAIQDVIDAHGGIRKIDYDTAERIAEKKSSKKITQLKNEFKKIDAKLENEYRSKVKEQKAIVPKDHVAVQKSDGTTGYIPKDNLKKFLETPGNKAL